MDCVGRNGVCYTKDSKIDVDLREVCVFSVTVSCYVCYYNRNFFGKLFLKIRFLFCGICFLN